MKKQMFQFLAVFLTLLLLAGCAGGIFAPAADLGSEPLLCALLGLAVTGLTVLPAMAGTPKPTKTD